MKGSLEGEASERAEPAGVQRELAGLRPSLTLQAGSQPSALVEGLLYARRWDSTVGSSGVWRWGGYRPVLLNVHDELAMSPSYSRDQSSVGRGGDRPLLTPSACCGLVGCLALVLGNRPSGLPLFKEI